MKNWTAILMVALILCFAAMLQAQANALLVGPTALSFTYVGAGLQPSSQGLLVTSSAGPVSFSASATTVGGGNWLVVGLASGTTPTTLSVAVNPAALTPGAYRGTVAISAAGVSNPTVLVGVNLTVRTTSQVASDPARLSFQYQVGGAAPLPQKLTITSNGAPLSVLPSVETFNGGAWLQVGQPFVNTNGTLDVSIQPGDLAPGNYSALITLTAPGATNSPISVPVSLTVSASPFLVVSGTPKDGPLAFAFQIGGPNPLPQSLTVTTTGPSINFTTTTSTSLDDWLRVGPAGGSTPAALGVSIDPGDLTPGTYTGFVTFAAAGAANSPLRVPVALRVTGSPIFIIPTTALAFDYQVGGALPAAQTLTIGGGGTLLNYNLSASTTTGGNWLAVGPVTGATDGTATVAVNPGNLAPGLYEGSVVVTGPGGANSPVTIPVTLNVTRSPLLQPSPAALSFAFQTGQATPTAQTIAVTSSGEPLTFSAAASTTTGGNWLHLGAPGGTTPGAVTLNVTPAGLAAGAYIGAVTIAAVGAGNSPVTIPVTLVVSDTALLLANPATLRFTSSGPSQVVNLSTTDGTPLPYNITTVAAGGWLQVNPRAGIAPGGFQVSVSAAGLAPGNYLGTIAVSAPGAANSPQFVTVSLAVAVSLAASPGELSFHHQAGANPPAAQSLAIGGAGLSFTAVAATQVGGDWLRVTPAGGSAPASLSVSVQPAGLAPGTYHGTITITAPRATNSPLVISVRLEVTGGGVVPAIAGVVNGASFQATPVAPGLIVAIFGAGIGPASGVGLQLAGGLVSTSAGDTQVLFDGTPAPILYASTRQVSVVVPYSVAGRTRSKVQIEYQGNRAGAEVQVADSAPGIFTVNASGAGPGAILNQNGTLNAADNPAVRNSVVVIYATGEGQTTPPGVDGLVTGTTLRHPTLPVRATIGGQEAEVLYAGSAPGLVSGVLQVNARVPAGVTPGSAVPVVVTVGGASSQAGVTLAVR